MEELVTSNLELYGPLAVLFLLMLSGFGLPVSEDLVIVPAGLLVGQGDMPLVPTLFAAWLGVAFSDCMWFVLCHRYGAYLIHKPWFKRMIHPRRLLEAKHQVETRGVWVIVMARFIPGSRTPTITIAGLLHLPFWQFFTATLLCVSITAPLQLGLGYLISLGLGAQRLADLVLYFIAGAMAVALVVFAVRWWKQHQPGHKRLPRARAAWLRRFRVRRIVRSLHHKHHRQAGKESA